VTCGWCCRQVTLEQVATALNDVMSDLIIADRHGAQVLDAMVGGSTEGIGKRKDRQLQTILSVGGEELVE
jgi:hypothetical protein